MSRERTITPEGAALLEQLAAADTEYRNATVTLEKRIRAEAEEKLEQMKIRRDIIAYQAKSAGVPVTRISRDGLHTTATITGYNAIENGQRYAGGATQEAEAIAERARFELVDGNVAFTPDSVDLAPVLEKLGLGADYVPEDATAAFAVDGGIITPITPAILPGGTMNPIVALVMADGSKHGRALVEFAEAAA